MKTIIQWFTSWTIKQVLSFLRFCNFYQQFIRDFVCIADSLTQLIKKDCSFIWSDTCQQAFQHLKTQITSASALCHFDAQKASYLETDSSDYVTDGVLSQEDDEEVLHSVAFYSHKMLLTECNYEIYNKKLLAIIKTFKNWRPELKGSAISVKILTDHRGLEYFQIKCTLTWRQTCWAEKLSEFNFVIQYWKDKSNQKVNALTKQSDSELISSEDEWVKFQNCALLSPQQFLTVASAEMKEVTIHDLIKKCLQADEDA